MKWELGTYFDISPVLSEATAVFPGDCAFRRKVALDLQAGNHLTLSSIETTLHIGAHVDAPSHYHRDGKPVDERPLSTYLGACQVIGVSIPRGRRIVPADLGGVEIRASRVIFRTGSFPDPNRWNGDFNSLSPELVGFLADRGVRLIGIDTPSVDPEDSKGLESHQALFDRGVANLEGVVLDGVPDGLYTLIALPLRIRGGDASPVRAILVPEAGP